MKKKTEETHVIVLNPDELQEESVYFNVNNELVKIKRINREGNELLLDNISDDHKILIRLNKHNLVKKVR